MTAAITDEQIVNGYEVVFPPVVRAAQRACLEHAKLTRDSGWPTISACLDFAALFGVPGADLAAFFGYLSYREGGRTVWVDALSSEVPSWTAQQRATREQVIAFGFQCSFRATVKREVAQ